MNKLITIIKELTDIDGISGDEFKVREYILDKIKNHIDSCHIDSIGNLIVFKKGKYKAENKVMLSAHMDEVGFIITNIEDNGLLSFATIGGIDTRSYLGKTVRIGSKRHIGVIGAGACHLAKSFDIAEPKDLRIDIGATTKEEALKYVSIGESVCFDSDYIEFGDDRIKAKALDDRAGCAIMMDIIMQPEIEYDLHFAFLVQEEVGMRGAYTAAYYVKPDYAIVIESTTASDIAGVKGADRACIQGEGAVVPFADGATLYSRELLNIIFDTAKEIEAKAQNKTMIAGGTDAGAIHQSETGIKASTISMPCRYIHSGSSMLKKSDILDTRKLVYAVANKYCFL